MGAFDNTIGAGYIGALATAVLFGVTCTQCLTYSKSCERDSSVLKYMVFFLFVTDTAHMVFVSHTMYWYAVTNYTNPEALQLVPWSLICGALADNLSDVTCRLFFTHRIWKLSRQNRPLTFIVLGLVFVTFLDGFGFSMKGFTVHNFVEFKAISWLLYTGFPLALVSDLQIAGILCYYLHKSRTGFKGTDSLINVLSAYAINTGLITAIFWALCFITYAAMPNNYVFIAFYFPLSKLYVNALLATLNARGKLREKGAVSSFHLNSSVPPGISGSHSNTSDTKFMHVHIQSEFTSDDMQDVESDSAQNIELKRTALTTQA